MKGLWKICAIDVNVGVPFTNRINCSLGFAYYCLHGSSGCLGSHVRPKLNSSLDEFKGKNNHDWKSTKTTLSEDFWTTSNCNMENTALQSCGSISSTSTLTQVYDAHGAGCSSTPSEFVNHGLILWNQNRQKWALDKKPESRAQQLREPKLSWNATYDSLLSNNKPFDKPVPLGEMVDFLVAVWEQEGMYD
ncbi:uncharacterized protein LOC125190102 isoform X1 [Salvia hispanica]|uniref:uncharacterized protein LOC125190102 isoform X1 n=1 Tax=Salvia hispanica TaxID=49212 RepID=UPI002008F939|nr:uncharacterized protein LOC125190102 isoform X1 [Salvia hispanica]